MVKPYTVIRTLDIREYWKGCDGGKWKRARTVESVEREGNLPLMKLDSLSVIRDSLCSSGAAVIISSITTMGNNSQNDLRLHQLKYKERFGNPEVRN